MVIDEARHYYERAMRDMEEKKVDWVAYSTNYNSRVNLDIADSIWGLFDLAALPATRYAIEHSGELLTESNFRDCIPRPDRSDGVILTRPGHILMGMNVSIWSKSEDRRNGTQKKKIARAYKRGAITEEQFFYAVGWVDEKEPQ